VRSETVSMSLSHPVLGDLYIQVHRARYASKWSVAVSGVGDGEVVANSGSIMREAVKKAKCHQRKVLL
jgi:hypothetical protein